MINKLEDLIYIKHNALEKEFCDHCIEKFKSDNRITQGEIGSGLNLDIKRSMDLNISQLDDWKGEDKIFYNSLHEAFEDYIDQHASYLTNLPNEDYKDTGYQIQETKPGDFYTWHTDYMVDREGWSRVLTYIWYLNDIDEGGETEFVMGNKIKPETGKLMLFPASWMYFHQGCTPTNKTKYITTGWIYFYSQDIRR